jgi:translation initiation factor 2B subunit (eIF-2B alpha/beta/delta family)
MANLRALAVEAETAAEFAAWLARRTKVLRELPRRLAANAWPHIENSTTVVTLSRSSAVAAALEGAWERGWGGSAVVLEGTASGHGADQARRLEVSGRAISRPDADAVVWLDVAVAVVLVGADAVGERRFVNSAGTRDLLELAHQRQVETILVADTGKDVEEEVLDEIVRRSPLHRESPDREWPIFEAVPLELVTARVTE